MTRAALVLCAGMAAVAPGMSGGAAGRPAPGGAFTPGVEPGARAPDSVSKEAARAVVRLGVIDLRLRESPAAADALVCEHLLALALEGDPDNAEIVRIASWIADLSEDDGLSATYLRRLVELDPADTFTQYRLISNLLKSIQSAEQRLVRYEAFLGAQGALLHPTIRSRLAHEAGTLLLERGDDAGAIAKLKLAISLDPTNKDAAVAAYKYYRSKLTDPAGKAELLVNLLMADPVNLDTHEELARVMASGGAFEGAKRFQTTAANILERAGVQQDIDGVVQTLSVDWPVDGPDKVVSNLNTALAVRRREQERLRAMMEEQLMPVQDVPTPDQVRLEPQLDKLRLLAAIAAKDEATAESAAADFKASYDQPVEYLYNPPPNVGVDIADPPAEARSLRLERATFLLWADRQSEFARSEVEAVAAEQTHDPQDPALLEARAWVVLRAAEPGAAVDLFKPLVGKSPSARAGLALSLSQSGRKDEAIAEFASIMRDMPLTPEAAWAWERTRELTGRKDSDAEVVRRLRSVSDGVPAWVDAASADPGLLMTLVVDLVDTSLDACEPAMLRVRLSNVAQVPLGLGPGRTIDSRFLLAPVLEVGLAPLRQGITPELIDADRRLRLNPRESLEFECWPDPGLSGWLAESLATDAVRTRWNVIQGFTRGMYGQVIPGPMCLRASSKQLVRSAIAEAGLSPSELAAKVGTAPEPELYRLAVATRALLLSLVKDPPNNLPGSEPAAKPRLSEGDAAELGRAFADRYPKCSPMARRLLAAALPHARQAPAVRPLDDAIRADTEPGVQAVFLVSRVTDAGDEALARARSSPDAKLRALADHLAERLTAGAASYGSLGPGLSGLLGPAPASAQDGLPPVDGAAPSIPSGDGVPGIPEERR